MQLQALSKLENDIDYCIINNVALEKTEVDLKKSIYVQILKVAITLIILITMAGFFIGLSEDSDLHGQVLEISQINLTEKPTTASITSTTGKSSLQLFLTFLQYRECLKIEFSGIFIYSHKSNRKELKKEPKAF